MLISILLLDNLNGQDYNKFVESGKEFLILQTIDHFCPPLMEVKRIGFIKYNRIVKNPKPILRWSIVRFDSDTLINGQEYSKIIQIYPDRIYTRQFIRENDNKEIFIINSSKDQYKLYDFNLHIDDTINNLIVRNIDTIVNSGIYRIKYEFDQCCKSGDKATWVTGLGNMKEIINHHYTTFCNCENSGIVGTSVGGQSEIKLIRVKKNNEIVYLDTDYVDFDFKEIDMSLKLEIKSN